MVKELKSQLKWVQNYGLVYGASCLFQILTKDHNELSSSLVAAIFQNLINNSANRQPKEDKTRLLVLEQSSV